MAKITLLEIVQDILSDADSDNVNSIQDTVEAEQCARVVRDVHDQIVDGHDLEFIKYDKRTATGNPQNFEYVDYLEVDDFLELVHSRSTSDSDTDGITLDSGLVIPVKNDKAPQYYTIMDSGSTEIVFDSYNSALETNLQASKS